MVVKEKKGEYFHYRSDDGKLVSIDGKQWFNEIITKDDDVEIKEALD